MTRHWQNQESGQVYSTDHGRITTESVRENCVEVKVVPLDAIVIDRSELPEVDPECPGFSGYVGLDGPGSAEHAPIALLGDAAGYRIAARRNLALAEYLTAHPPVDEALVGQIRDLALAADVTLTGTQVDTIARYFAGRVQVTS